MKFLKPALILIVVMASSALLFSGRVFAQSNNTPEPIPPVSNTPSPSSTNTNSNTNSQAQQPKTIADSVCLGVLFTGTEKIDPNNVTVNNCEESGESDFGFLIRRIINIFTIVVGAVSVIMIIIGGFRYIISGGDSSGVSGAKNTILYAIVGLVVVLFAQIIIRFVLSNLTPGAN